MKVKFRVAFTQHMIFGKEYQVTYLDWINHTIRVLDDSGEIRNFHHSCFDLFPETVIPSADDDKYFKKLPKRLRNKNTQIRYDVIAESSIYQTFSTTIQQKPCVILKDSTGGYSVYEEAAITQQDWEDIEGLDEYALRGKPKYWWTDAAFERRYRVYQLIFRTNEEALAYVEKQWPMEVGTACVAWAHNDPTNSVARAFLNKCTEGGMFFPVGLFHPAT